MICAPLLNEKQKMFDILNRIFDLPLKKKRFPAAGKALPLGRSYRAVPFFYSLYWWSPHQNRVS